MLLFLKGEHHFLLLLRSHTTEYRTLCNGTLHILRCGNGCGINIAVCIFQTGFFRNGGNGHRIITGNYFQVHALVFEKCKRLRSIVSDNIGDHKQRYRLQASRQLILLIQVRAVGQYQNTQAFFSICSALADQVFVSFREKELGSAHQVSSLFFESYTAVFTVR